MLTHRLLLAALATTLLVTGCQDDDNPNPGTGTGTGTGQGSNRLVPNAGTNQVALVGNTVTLDGSQSRDTENRPFTFRWAITSRPAGSTASILIADVPRPTFVPDKPGEYKIELTLSNGAGETAKAEVTVVVSAPATTVLDATISQRLVLNDVVADPNVPDYLANGSVAVNAELVVMPGVTIGFARDARLTINTGGGLLIADGTATQKVRFIGQQATKGFWQGIFVNSTSNANSLSYAEVLHTGSSSPTSVKAGLTLSANAQLGVKNSLFSLSDGYGLHLVNNAVLREFAANTFSSNTEAGLYLPAKLVSKLDAASHYTGSNGRDVVEIHNGVLSNLPEAIWPSFADGTPYRLLNDLGVDSGLKLSPGVKLQLGPNASINVGSNGYLSAIGTATSRITITGAQATQGYWKGIGYSFASSAQNVLEYVDISGGGGQRLGATNKGNVVLHGNGASRSRVLVRNCAISNSGGYGIVVGYDTQLNTDAATVNTFSGNAQGSIVTE